MRGHRARRERVHAVELRLGITRAIVRPRVGQPVARQHAVQTRPAHPVIDVPMLGLDVHELDARARRQQKTIRRLRDVTAMVKPIRVHVRRELHLDLARHRIAPDELARHIAGQRRRVPHEAVGHDQILRRTVAGFVVRRAPQLLPRVDVQALHRTIAARVEHHVVVQHHARPEIVLEQFPLRRGRPRPALRARRRIELNQFVAVVKHHALAIRRERERRDLHLRLAPQQPPRTHLDRHQIARLLIPIVLRLHALLIARVVLRRELLEHPRPRIHETKQHAADVQDFLRALRALEHARRLARRRIDLTHRRVDAERHEHALAIRDEPPRQLRRPRFQRPQIALPLFDALLPKHRTIERVARDQRPLRGQQNRNPRTLIHDVKNPPARRHHRAQARHPIMMPRPARTAHPLQPLRRRDHLIVRRRGALRVVVIVRPLVERRRAFLHRLHPLAVLPHERDAVGHEHAQHLAHRHAAQILRDQQVHQIVDERQLPPVEKLHAHRPINTELLNRLARRRHLCRVKHQPENLKTRTRA